MSLFRLDASIRVEGRELGAAVAAAPLKAA